MSALQERYQSLMNREGEILAYLLTLVGRRERDPLYGRMLDELREIDRSRAHVMQKLELENWQELCRE